MSRSVPSQMGGNGDMRQLRIHRVSAGDVCTVRLLESVDRILGVQTHFVAGRSEYCCGETCKLCRPHPKRYWKGYIQAEGQQADKTKWLPVLLEVTENLELDMRGRTSRGSIWELARRREAKGERNPVTGVHKGQVDPAKLRGLFDGWPLLFNIYRIDTLVANLPSPLPARHFISITKDIVEPPGDGYQFAEAEDKDAVLRRMQRTAAQPLPSNVERNGTH